MKSIHAVSRIALTALALAAAASSHAQTVTEVVVGKNIDYVQTSATLVQVNPTPQGPAYGGPYGFSVNVGGQNVDRLPTPVVSGPFNTAALGSFLNGGRLLYSAPDGLWRLGSPNANDWGSPTRADLDSKFGSGTYTVVVNGVSVPLNLSGDAFPSPPVLTLSGGTWANGKYVVDPSKTFTVTSSPYTGYGSHREDQISVGIDGGAQRQQLHSQVPGTNFLSVSVPASSLTPGTEYNVGAEFSAVVDFPTVAALPGSTNAAFYGVSTVAKVVLATPVFPMVVTSSITPTVADVRADIKYRPQDVGTTGNVYVFALAPAAIVKGARQTLDDSKATGLGCVLAQLTSNGFTAVTASSMQAYLSGVLGSQGASITVLNSVSTALVQGAVLYVGYGASSAAMLNDGINRSVVTVPSSQATCQPQPPQTGWWWNKDEPGRGFSIEAYDNRLFMAGYLYDASGRATWTVAGGRASLDGSLFHGALQNFGGGQTLQGAYKPAAPSAPSGDITLTFSDERNGTLAWPGGVINITRFDIAAPAAAPAFVPQSGWWWSSAEGGRGYFMEFANNTAFIAGYMYDTSGNPLWYLASGPMTAPSSFQQSWTQYSGGQTLTGAYRAPTLSNPNVGPMSIQFENDVKATLTIGGRQIAISRFGF